MGGNCGVCMVIVPAAVIGDLPPVGDSPPSPIPLS